MSDFSAEWLALREPYDLAGRNREVLDALAKAFAERFALTVADLACGTGSTLRAISSHLPNRQNWRLFDNNLSLLGRAAAGEPPHGVSVATIPVDLARDLEAALDGAVDLVTTSALLDLVSREWLERFVLETAARRLPVYAAMSYDGRATLRPADPLDAPIIAAMNRHQLTDKGFGPALGPSAAAFAIERFERAGYAVVSGSSEWDFGPDDRGMQLRVLAGWATAAQEMDNLSAAEIADWLERRGKLVMAGGSSMRVGHVDFFAQPIGTR